VSPFWLKPALRLSIRFLEYPQPPAHIPCKKQVLKSIELLIANSSHPSLRFEKIQGTEGFFELSVNKSLRIIVRVDTSGQEQINTFYIIGKHEQVFPVK
jgi:hypothetical protein